MDWSGDNFAAVTEDDRLGGMVIVTAMTREGLMSDLREAIHEHVADEDVPEWLKCGDYDFEVITP